MLFTTLSVTYQIPPGLLSALCYVESTHNPAAIHHDDGNSDSLGVCQIKLETAKALGFKGSKTELMKPEVNVKYAAKYLRKQLNRYGGDTPRAVAAYNTGTYRPGSKTFARNQSYVDRVFISWAKRK